MSDKAKSILLLLTASLIWGVSFPLNSLALQHIDPFGYSALRYIFASIALTPVAMRWGRRTAPASYFTSVHKYCWVWGGLLAGFILTVGNGFLFAGLSMTLSAKAGFINSLYVTMVPLVGLVLGVVPSKLVWVGLAVSVVGLGFISGLGSLESEAFNRGDAYVLVADLFWATHIFILGYFTVRVSPWLFIFSQTVFGCVFSFVLAHITADSPTMAQFIAIWPYAVWGIFSVAGAYVCQATAQRTASPTSAALVMQSQAIIAGISGVIILNEKLTLTMIMGAFLMVGGTIVAQLATDSTKLSPDLPHYRGWQTVRVITAFVILAICAFAVIQT